MAAPRRRKIGSRRRVEDEGDEEGGPDALELDDDSLSDGSIISGDNDHGDDSDTSDVDETSPTAPNGEHKANGKVMKGSETTASQTRKDSKNAVTDTEMMLHGLAIADEPAPPQEMHFDEVASSTGRRSPTAPIVVSSASATRDLADPPGGRRRQEHEDYKKRRDEDPAFVPNRGSFFMHDHRHPGPSANGFRPFGRGRGRGGRGGIGGPFAPINNHIHHPSDPTTNSPWTHDMHEAVADPGPRRPRPAQLSHAPPMHNSNYIPTCEPSKVPINRTLSTEKHIGNAQVRVSLPQLNGPVVLPAMPIKQYTKLPDHRPPLRRDKPVRISLPEHNPKYIYPAADRSFIFIPRAMRPNQQRSRGKPRSGFGSVGGYSRRTSVYGGSYYGSVYSPSIAMSRRSSVVHERDYMFSPTGSVVSRAAVAPEPTRPVVRLPPSAQPGVPLGPAADMAGRNAPMEASSGTSSQHNYLLPQKPAFQESQASHQIPMHQPRPQKNISMADLDPPQLSQGNQAFQGAFHQQVPLQMSNGAPMENHQRQLSYPSQHSTGTPLSQIPERAIHAAPFQPHTFGQHQPPMHQQPSLYTQQQPGYPPQQQQPGYYYPPGYAGPPTMPPAQAPGFAPPVQQSEGAGGNLVAQEVNGMVYYYDAAQLAQPVNSYPSYPSAGQPYQASVMGMGGMVTPSPDTYYYPQGGPPPPGMMYYPQ
ncbi:hypothetical protein CC79DRAFT_1369556 [Sarocladium strictum]